MRSVTLTTIAASAAAALALIAAYTPEPVDAPHEPTYVGLVLEVKKSCVVRDDERSTQTQTLAGKKAVGTKLRAGQQLQCAQGGSLKFRYVASGAEVVVTQMPPAWYTVVNVPMRKNPGGPGGRLGGRTSEYFQMPSALDLAAGERAYYADPSRYNDLLFKRKFPGNRGDNRNSNANANGSPRQLAVDNGNSNASANSNTGGSAMAGVGDAMYARSSPQFSFVPPSPYKTSVDTFAFRWWDARGHFLINLSLRDAQSDEVIWGPLKVVSGQRTFAPEEARAALRAFRAKRPGVAVKIVATYGDTLLDRVEASLLSIEEERALAQELAALGPAGGLANRIDRADVYASYNLLAEAADEYEAALAESPENDDLLAAAALAQCRIRNYPRLYDLANSLQTRAQVSSELFRVFCGDPYRR